MLRFLGLLALIAIGVLVVGLFRGWFSVSMASAGDGSSVEVEVDGDRLSEDVESVRSEIGDVVQGDPAGEIGDAVERVSGRVVSVDADARQIAIAIEGSSGIESYQLDEATTIELGSRPATIDALREADRVELWIREDAGDRRVVKLVLRRS